MRGSFYTATFKVRDRSSRKVHDERERTVILREIHPTVFVAAYPDMSQQAGALLHWAALSSTETDAILEAYAALGRNGDIYTAQSVQNALVAHIQESRAKGAPADEALLKLAGVRKYAHWGNVRLKGLAETGIELPG